jgi:hypothetical protein
MVSSPFRLLLREYLDLFIALCQLKSKLTQLMPAASCYPQRLITELVSFLYS